jgi:bacterioferritin-associated ferredoxin
MKIRVELEGRDFIEVECEGDNPSAPGPIKNVSILGCAEFMDMMQKMRKAFGPDIAKWPVPQATDHSSLLLKEMILRLRGEWAYPYAEDEVCHCRNISTHAIDQAIIGGAHSPEVVTRQTSASSACGTCRPEVQKIIDYRLGRKTA